MATFVDPRSRPTGTSDRPPTRITSDPSELLELERLCREGRVYEVERWIAAGKPLQLASGVAQRRRRPSALELALDGQNQALALLLLSNGYDPNLEPDCPLDWVLAARRWDLLDLLLEWGADPRRVDLEALFGTYDSKLFARFREMGVDLTCHFVMARTLGEHTSNKPLFGFVRRHRKEDPGFQRALDMALVLHAGEGSEKGIHLCLWAGANPHAPVPNLRYLRYGSSAAEEEDDEPTYGRSAIHEACAHDRPEVLRLLRPDPAIDDFSDLYGVASSRRMIQELAQIQPPREDDSTLLLHHLWRATMGFREWWVTGNLDAVFEQGVRWRTASMDEIASARHSLVRAPDRAFVELMRLLAHSDHCTPEILAELTRTPAMRAKMQKVGFIPTERGGRTADPGNRPSGSREVLWKCGIELPKPAPPPLPRTVWIGWEGPGSEETRMTRAELFERVWATPVATLCRHWGFSGPGLAKACKRLKIPVPPRGYWGKKGAGRGRPRRPVLPALPPGQAEEVIVWIRVGDVEGTPDALADDASSAEGP
jgi:hypothetical protein